MSPRPSHGGRAPRPGPSSGRSSSPTRRANRSQTKAGAGLFVPIFLILLCCGGVGNCSGKDTPNKPAAQKSTTPAAQLGQAQCSPQQLIRSVVLKSGSPWEDRSDGCT